MLKKLKANHPHSHSQDHSKLNIPKKDIESEFETDFIDHSSFATNLFQNPANEVSKQEGFHAEDYYPWNENFMWNYFLMKEFFSIVSDKKWVLPVIHGYIN